jgi:hypothetical protein
VRPIDAVAARKTPRARGTRRVLIRWLAGGALGAISCPSINRFALGATVPIALARAGPLDDDEARLFAQFAANLKSASNDTIDLSIVRLADPRRLFQDVAEGRYDGIYRISAREFADQRGVYSAPEPGYRLVADTLAAFETREQQRQWFEAGGGFDYAKELFIPSWELAGVVPLPSVRLCLRQRIEGLSQLRGMRIAMGRGFVADFLVSAGCDAFYGDTPWMDPRLGRWPPDGLLTDYGGVGVFYGTSPSAMHIVDLQVSMSTSCILFARRGWIKLTLDQQGLLLRHAAMHGRALQAMVTQREGAWFDELANNQVQVVRWSPEERAGMRHATNGFLRTWAEGGPPTRRRFVDSIEAWQRRSGLI